MERKIIVTKLVPARVLGCSDGSPLNKRYMEIEQCINWPMFDDHPNNSILDPLIASTQALSHFAWLRYIRRVGSFIGQSLSSYFPRIAAIASRCHCYKRTFTVELGAFGGVRVGESSSFNHSQTCSYLNSFQISNPSVLDFVLVTVCSERCGLWSHVLKSRIMPTPQSASHAEGQLCAPRNWRCHGASWSRMLSVQWKGL
jgi:hypothetical protein